MHYYLLILFYKSKDIYETKYDICKQFNFVQNVMNK